MTRVIIATACILAAGAVSAQVSVSLDSLRLVPVNAVRTRATHEQDALRITFAKADEHRRMLPLRARPAASAEGTRALAFRYRLVMQEGEAPRLAALVFDSDGASWLRLAGDLAPADELTDARVSLAALRPTSFSPQAGAGVAWDRVGEVWIGLVLDGPAAGTLDITAARLTSEPHRPTHPLRLTGDGPGAWTLFRDPAVQGAVTVADEGPDGRPCMKIEYAFPGRRHMYCNASAPVPPVDLEGYTALRITYRATLPPGIRGLLVMLAEDTGAIYRAEPMPPPSDDWTTLTIPLDELRLAEWMRAGDPTLDLDRVVAIWIGSHGTAIGDGGPGVIRVCDIELVP